MKSDELAYVMSLESVSDGVEDYKFEDGVKSGARK